MAPVSTGLILPADTAAGLALPLADLLTALPHNDEALRVADSLARHLTPDQEAARLAQVTAAARGDDALARRATRA